MTNMSPTKNWAELRQTIGVRVLKFVREICFHRYRRGRYFLVEQPAGVLSWIYRRVATMLFQLPGVFFAYGDQWRYGKVDPASGKKARKHTGYPTNSQALLKHLAFRCACGPGCCPWPGCSL